MNTPVGQTNLRPGWSPGNQRPMPDHAAPTPVNTACEVNRRSAASVQPEMGRTTTPPFQGHPDDCAFAPRLTDLAPWPKLFDVPAEHDPDGLDAHAPGAKLDAGKPRAGLVLGDFARALLAVSIVGTYGATKYTDSGWAHVANGHARYTDAMLRHWLAEASGETRDPSGLRHSAQVAWNALARLELELRAITEPDHV